MKLYGVVGRKDQGKTTLITGLVSHFAAQGLRVSTLKHAHKGFDVDQPGRDSHAHRLAGAGQVLVSSPNRWALMTELRGAQEAPLDLLLAQLAPVDLVLVEGYKQAPHPKIEVYRQDRGEAPLAGGNPTIKALAGDPGGHAVPVPVWSVDDVAGLARFIAREVDL
ncbi:MAG: molybdopterin-guanine dinucleotide biosynthesis protein B [Pseudomonadota bacterium]